MLKKSSLRVLVLSATFPSVADPFRGVFVKERIRALANLPGFDVRVVAPVPWFPPIAAVPKWHKWSQYPRQETLEDLDIVHPRYPLPPKVGGYLHSELMYPPIRRCVDRIRESFPFDLIDSHFVYPSGVVATRLARRYDVPVVMTGRGEDMIRFPNQPLVGDRIRWALRHATRCIGVSREIADAMLRNGAKPEKTSVLANGIDQQKFHPLSASVCRQRLGLPNDRKIVLSVGEMIPRKGFDLLVRAMPTVLKQHPDALLVIVGRSGRFGRDCTEQIQTLVRELSLQDHVQMAGASPHDELVSWYNAADLFVLMSASEGSPNVLLEAFACGIPCVATRVGGIPDEFDNPCLGHLLQSRTSEAAAEKIIQSLGTDWNRQAIADHMKQRTWSNAARQFATILQEARNDYRPRREPAHSRQNT